MTDIYEIQYSSDAREDLKGIYSYIAFSLKEPQTAEKQVNRIREAVRSLDFLPERYSKVDWEPWASIGMRKLPVNQYVIYYLVDKSAQRVVISRIFYGGRNVEEIIQAEHL